MRAGPSFVLVTALALGVAACDRGVARPPDEVATAPTPTVAPRVVVLIVIDQLPSWSFDAQRSALGGGIARLLREGAYWPRAAYPYATTHTAPGHATIASGTTPSVHGIIANRWFDRATERLLDVDVDPTHPVFGKAGKPLGFGFSGLRMRAPGLADALHTAHPDGRAVAIGWKARAAILVLGQQPDLAVWFDPSEGVMTTSTAFARQLPPWLGEMADRTALPRVSAPWKPTDAALVARLAGGPDDAPFEGDPYGLGSTFPHELSRASSPYKALAFMPEASSVIVDTAIAALDGESLGADATPDILAITFSPHDFAGHVWCQESWERVDHLLHIDRELGRLFATLDDRFGEAGWAAVLTSDHGALPSRARRDPTADPPAIVHIDRMVAVAQESAATVLGTGRWVLGATPVELTMTAAFHAQPPDRRDRAYAAMTTALRGLELHWVSRSDAAREHCDGDGIAAMACRSIHAAHSGDIFVVGKEWGLVSDEHDECTAHGSPWPYDREVPVVVRAAGWTPGARADTPSMLSIAPTIAAILGIAAPTAARAAPLPRTP